MRTYRWLGIGLLLAGLGSGCGGGGDEVPPLPTSGNTGVGNVSVASPGATESAAVQLEGGAFISPNCVRFGCGSGEERTTEVLTGVAVTWTNSTTGMSGAAFQDVGACWFLTFFLCNHRWRASIPVALGSNDIRITAADAFGNLGTATLAVVRAPDFTAPTATASSPGHQSSGVPVDANLSATFSEPMDPSTLNGASFVLFDANNNAVPGDVSYAGNTATFDPISILTGASTYTARITTAVKDLAGGNPMANDFDWTFTTGSSQWLATSTNGAPTYSSHAAVWTGTRILIWGSDGTGASYAPGNDTWQSMSRAGAPTERGAHSAVWTGSEMIVWGGLQSNPVAWVNSGGRYLPSIDSWQSISTVNAPSPRLRASVVWTGTEMIVWGGLDAQTTLMLSDGAGYNPVTDTWRPLATVGAPSGREGHTAVWTGTEMVVWGGIDETISWTNTGGRYNPATDRWEATAIGNAPVGRNNHSAVWTGIHMVIWGGTSGAAGNPRLNTGARYNPATDSWQATTTVGSASARLGHTALWTGSEMFVWGGVDTSGTPVNSGGRYDPATNKWSQMETSGAPAGRSGHTSTWTGAAMVVWGGTAATTGGRFVP